MAHYAYKNVIYDRIPSNFYNIYEEVHKEKTGEDYDGDPNYDGDAWSLTAAYIDWLRDGSPEDIRQNIVDNFWS